MYVKIPLLTFKGLVPIPVTVEINISNRGLPCFDIVGLPGKSVEESKQRVKTALINSNIDFPNKKIVINLAPADVAKDGSYYDLAVAVGIYCANEGINPPANVMFFGELSIDGTINKVKRGYLSYLYCCQNEFKAFVTSTEDCLEIGCSDNSKSETLLAGYKTLANLIVNIKAQTILKSNNNSEFKTHELKPQIAISNENTPEIVIGQEQAKRALLIAAAGKHNLLITGPPGTGKTLLAKMIPAIMPPLTKKESLEIAQILSYKGLSLAGNLKRPFRSPHHTTSIVGMIGGGVSLTPGEVTLAHNGVLFMDEFCEFPRNILESLRQPLQDGYVRISRAAGSYEFPSRFLLVAASNPCPCGYYGDPKVTCKCNENKIKNYRLKLSGPISDRIDLHVIGSRQDANKISAGLNTRQNGKDIPQTEVSFYNEIENMKKSVVLARDFAQSRFKDAKIAANGDLQTTEIKKYCRLSSECNKILNSAANLMNMSTRGYIKTIKISRTIADLEMSQEIKAQHLAEALQYRANREI